MYVHVHFDYTFYVFVCVCVLLLQITIVSFLVSDSIPFTTVELLRIEPADMTVESARDRVQVIGKKQGAKGPVSSVTFQYSILLFHYLHYHTSFCHLPA